MALFRRSGRAASQVHPREVPDLLEGGAALVDVREPYEFHAGHAPSAWHIPLSTLAHKAHLLPKDCCVLVICRSGSRSARATSLLREMGVDARNVTGGMHAWMASGLPVEANAGGSGRIV